MGTYEAPTAPDGEQVYLLYESEPLDVADPTRSSGETPHSPPMSDRAAPAYAGVLGPVSAAPVEFQVLACPGRWLVPTPPAVLAAVRSRVTRGPVAFALVEFSGVRRSASTHR